ncbi:hypothetical protein [Lewinella sp. IMCC34191]|uniref:hypothetical protein n=1 Tax=Lewinella sp. IMCC34191 TaxID=2259172 RepID=UPI001300B933|nr:hypothetical protein [Lewinella sp. IMCC34191]
MKRFTLPCLLMALGLTFSHGLTAQDSYFELGVQGGDMPYNGDLSEAGIGFLSNWNTFGGFYLRYRPINRVGLRFNGIFGRIDGTKTQSIGLPNNQRGTITRTFRSPITEFSLAAEVDLFYLGDPDDIFVAPYVMAGIGRTSFNPQAENRDGILVDLQPLRTEGQGIEGGVYDPFPYDLDIVTFHLGGGVRARLSDRFVLGGEVSGRVTGTDYLDDVSATQVNYNDVLENGGSESAYFSNPAVTPGDVPDTYSYKRGGPSNDFYFLINLTLGIRLGGWGSNASGCYSF